MIKIVSIVGARPQFVKAAVMSRAFSRLSGVEEVLVHTDQHYDEDMSAVFFRDLGLREPSYHLGINKKAIAQKTGREPGPARLLSAMIGEIESVLLAERPDWVLVYGDTDSTLAGALTADMLHIPLIHIEAGLRSFNRAMPEERNRILTDRLATLLFCPSDEAVRNLEREGVSQGITGVFRSGDIMCDAARYYAKNAKPLQEITDIKEFILCTLHRKENISDPTILLELMEGLEEAAALCPVVLPLHPHTKARLAEAGYRIDGSKIRFIEPVGYLQMCWLLNNCKFVMTDSGGLQKEAYFFCKPCLTMREQTEWVELVSGGCNFLVGHSKQRMKSMVSALLSGACTTVFAEGLYGNGHAGEEIARIIVNQSQKA